jgi:hypothetical protein
MRTAAGCGIRAAKKPMPSAGCKMSQGAASNAIAKDKAEMKLGPEWRPSRAIGWAFHYAVGIVYAALYLAIIRLEQALPDICRRSGDNPSR